MAKMTGLGMAFYVDGVDLSGDTREFGEIGGGPAPLEFTSINRSAFERKGGLRDGRMSWTSFFNPDGAHPELASLPRTGRIATACMRTAIGSDAACIHGKQITYDLSRTGEGELTAPVNIQGDGYALEWGNLHTPAARTDTAATDGPSVDAGVGTAFGLQAYLHVVSFTGTDATVKLQSSSDDGAVDTWADVTGGAFAQITTGPQAQRIQTARNLAVERYLRVVTTTTGGFTNLQFLVVVARNETEVTF